MEIVRNLKRPLSHSTYNVERFVGERAEELSQQKRQAALRHSANMLLDLHPMLKLKLKPGLGQREITEVETFTIQKVENDKALYVESSKQTSSAKPDFQVETHLPQDSLSRINKVQEVEEETVSHLGATYKPKKREKKKKKLSNRGEGAHGEDTESESDLEVDLRENVFSRQLEGDAPKISTKYDYKTSFPEAGKEKLSERSSLVSLEKVEKTKPGSKEKKNKKKKKSKKKKKEKKLKDEFAFDPEEIEESLGGPEGEGPPLLSKGKSAGPETHGVKGNEPHSRSSRPKYGKMGASDKSDPTRSDIAGIDKFKRIRPIHSSAPHKKRTLTAPDETLQADFRKSLKQLEKQKAKSEASSQGKSKTTNYGMSPSKLAALKESLNKDKRKAAVVLNNGVGKRVLKRVGLSREEKVCKTKKNAREEEKMDEAHANEHGISATLTDRKRPLKRARVRKRMPVQQTGGLDLRRPTSTITYWNASEIIKDFLYIGAGRDQNQRCLVNHLGDSIDIKTERMKWCRSRNMCYILNMAGSPLQKELVGISYPLIESHVMKIDMNDLDTWTGKDMEEGFEKGARFIEEAWEAHKAAKEKKRKLASVTGDINIQPPSIFVHCVAGVNRSPMVVVWWLCRYHGLHLKDAWELVRKRRDSGAHWKDVTLGGECPPDDFDPDLSLYEHKGVRKFQHPFTEEQAESNKEMHSSYSTTETQQSGDATETSLPYPKYLWYKHAKELLSCYFKRHWTENGNKDPSPPGEDSRDVKQPRIQHESQSEGRDRENVED